MRKACHPKFGKIFRIWHGLALLGLAPLAFFICPAHGANVVVAARHAVDKLCQRLFLQKRVTIQPVAQVQGFLPPQLCVLGLPIGENGIGCGFNLIPVPALIYDAILPKALQERG